MIQLTGSFTTVTAVVFGSAAGTIVSVLATQILATSPAGTAGTVDVTLVTPGGTSAVSSADQFTYVATPAVTGVSPAGPAAGGTTVTITGTRFTGATLVDFGTTAATNVFFISAHPDHGHEPGGHRYGGRARGTAGRPLAGSRGRPVHLRGSPTVTDVSPAWASAGGTTVTITGTGFTGATPWTSARPRRPTWSSSLHPDHGHQPGGRGYGERDGDYAGRHVAVFPADQFTYVAPPTVTAVNPSQGC